MELVLVDHMVHCPVSPKYSEHLENGGCETFEDGFESGFEILHGVYLSLDPFVKRQKYYPQMSLYALHCSFHYAIAPRTLDDRSALFPSFDQTIHQYSGTILLIRL